MKISYSNFEKTQEHEPKHHALRFDVAVDPDDADGEKIKKYVVPYEYGDLDDLIFFLTNFQDLMESKGYEEDGPAKFRYIKILLKGDAKKAFAAAHDEATEDLEEDDDHYTNEIFEQTMERFLTEELSDPEASSKLKDCVICRKLKMPSKVKEIVKRIRYTNEALRLLPGDTEP
eukprot:CAMPEP_0178764938 /NCGR_PEP_ID=MMETSP0744-20121128/18126_1 /TAXON_ID=913974 /ORGANISM="Nitzschia punctata, Strain CCMP561" /LENGTH=173 /DNA_ID=CAMNT_0020420283 /DNA_START=297 /DNA_END=814 /DNA_ORIENTATION=+